MPSLILASQSLGRKKLLEYLKIPFEIVHSQLDEEKIIAPTPEKTLQLRAKLKGEEIALKIAKPAIIISADSGAILGRKLLGKPKDRQEAVGIFKRLAGKKHKYVTSTYIIKIYTNKTKSVIFQSDNVSFVTFRKMSDDGINFFLDRTEFTRFAAGYILVSAQDFITKVEGSLSNVIGLPLEDVIPVLKKEGLL
ncbi:MAG: maf protein, septum formation protein [Candidatus Gottesmanbacteria bacterium GW2011_GWA2_43_14]|uniref:Nucleoside triphosphate pyrophosphatase n=1 Tax=Candidatus Gottesmanbacteria bacterium GW2011_GWA2_43_14 TaxID=1618443 RepID=A0A0G1DJC0_9BACT|nr:MAG: maf protein, septum formation protein [Candidatus Gottesmanbacteria bacterium GW2011_GWA2_43_14]